MNENNIPNEVEDENAIYICGDNCGHDPETCIIAKKHGCQR